MKARTSRKQSSPPTELRGVVKKMAGRLTNDPKLEREGRAEMGGSAKTTRRAAKLNPDPHRRG